MEVTLLAVGFWMLVVSQSLLPIACCLLPIALCLLPVAYCLLPVAYCLVPVALCLTTKLQNRRRTLLSGTGSRVNSGSSSKTDSSLTCMMTRPLSLASS